MKGKGEFSSLGKPMRPHQEVVSVERVEVVTLDGYCGEHEIGPIDLLKIDVEGAERDVLHGAANLLGGAKSPPIVCEFNERTMVNMGYTSRDLRQAFEDLGYEMFTFDAAGRRLVPEPIRERYDATENLIATKDETAFQRLLQGDGRNRSYSPSRPACR